MSGPMSARMPASSPTDRARDAERLGVAGEVSTRAGGRAAVEGQLDRALPVLADELVEGTAEDDLALVEDHDGRGERLDLGEVVGRVADRRAGRGRVSAPPGGSGSASRRRHPPSARRAARAAGGEPTRSRSAAAVSHHPRASAPSGRTARTAGATPPRRRCAGAAQGGAGRPAGRRVPGSPAPSTSGRCRDPVARVPPTASVRVGCATASIPSTSTVPASGRSSPTTREMSVVLPAPFGPRNATISPGATSRSTPRRASTSR